MPLLAGCTQGNDPAPPAPGLPASALEAGRYYGFAHAGGALAFTLDGEGEASFDLYGGDDQRLGSVGFSSSPGRTGLHRIEGVDPGEVVLRLVTLNGTLNIDSGAERVQAFRPLLATVDRILLIDRPPRMDLLGGIGLDIALPGQTPADETVAIDFPRAPSDLRVLANGPWANLTVEVHNDRGLVLSAQDPGLIAAPTPGGTPRTLETMLGAAVPQNLRAGPAAAHVRADDLAGAVVLELESFSRAALPGPALTGPAVGDVRFTYGALPDGPVAFTVHASTRALMLWQDGPAADNASVALFGPHDEPLGVVRVPSKGTAQVPVAAGGDYVAVRLGGRVSLGADRTPSAFDLRPLEVQETTLPSGPMGLNGRYAIGNETLDAVGAFELRPGSLTSDGPDLQEGQTPLGGCDRGRFLRVDQGGETLVATLERGNDAAIEVASFAEGTLALGQGPLTVTHDGFGGDGCARPAVVVRSYVRAV